MSVGLIGGRAELERYWKDDVGTSSHLTKNEAAALLAYIESLETTLANVGRWVAANIGTKISEADYAAIVPLIERVLEGENGHTIPEP